MSLNQNKTDSYIAICIVMFIIFISIIFIFTMFDIVDKYYSKTKEGEINLKYDSVHEYTDDEIANEIKDCERLKKILEFELNRRYCNCIPIRIQNCNCIHLRIPANIKKGDWVYAYDYNNVLQKVKVKENWCNKLIFFEGYKIIDGKNPHEVYILNDCCNCCKGVR